MYFRMPNAKFTIEFQILRCRFRIIRNFDAPISCFSGIQILKNQNFKFWQNRCLHFHKILIQNFDFEGSIYKILPRISLSTQNFCSPNFSSTHRRSGESPAPSICPYTIMRSEFFERTDCPEVGGGIAVSGKTLGSRSFCSRRA